MRRSVVKTPNSGTPCRTLGLRRTFHSHNSSLDTTSTPNASAVTKDAPKSSNLASRNQCENDLCSENNATTTEGVEDNSQMNNTELKKRQSYVNCEDYSGIMDKKQKVEIISPRCLLEKRTSSGEKSDSLASTNLDELDLQALQRRVTLKEKQLRELRHHNVLLKKHNPADLNCAIQTWLKACQEALEELLMAANRRGCDMSMEKLLLELRIPASLVQYNIDNAEFEF